ncbi:50S ribosome-binding GTPase [Alicyclobacillus cycloheptanicus]|jgi:predicted GTPase|uniref:GTPase n=1 Tax=Alicyclobacillus cycloheptanicus TaxID=1457 RepID=A0ABT9XGK7_9BACL|nr:GTPase [Alicyclobacillus cycloheptanicus]MDQ0189317.1 putative GTPase [Alicyclobacillus cycloheptanicus]WDM01323.1 50S ribosome-binding GTPase [Alicyclobacillus cycloheptanicus]
MRRSVVIGKTNVGKTLFCVHFAQYIGVKEMTWLLERADGRTEQVRMSPSRAEALLSGAMPHTTRCLQSICLEFARGKGSRQLLLTDTTGLVDGIHPEPELRAAMAQTLKAILDADVVLHLVDAASIGRREQRDTHAGAEDDDGQESGWSLLDDQIAQLGQEKDGYLILANKMDLGFAKAGYRALVKRFTKHRVIPISARYQSGFREVKQHVWRMA